MIEQFFEFIYERQAIWHKRQVLALPALWTDDEVLQAYKFCNVYRELDGGTIVLTNYLNQPLSPEQKLFNIVAYRFFNRRDTIEALFGGLLNPQSFDFKDYEQRFDEVKKKQNIFSNAYLITAKAYNAQYRQKDKHIQVLLMLDDLRANLSQIIAELQKASAQDGLQIIERNIPLAGPFLAGQILLDCTYAKNIVDYTANDFLIVGPGAWWGLNIIFGKKLCKAEADAQCRYLHAVQAQEFAKLKARTGKDWLEVCWQNPYYPNYPYLALHDIQNSLCEFRKYWRLKNGEKAKKRYYHSAGVVSGVIASCT